MRVPIAMPKLSFEMTSGVVARWVKSAGDVVAVGDVVVEIEAEKATVEHASPAAGTLVEIVHAVGDEVACGEPLAFLEIPDPRRDYARGWQRKASIPASV